MDQAKNMCSAHNSEKIAVDFSPQCQQQCIVSLNDKPYEIVQEYTKKQSEYCYAIAFNQEQTVMIAACDSKITVFEFKEGQLNQKQILQDHNSGNRIRTLYFMKKYNQFISGTDYDIGIWSFNNATQYYYCLQMLKKAHSSWINRVIMNKKEDLIISCSYDETIKFWIKKKVWECSQTITNHRFYVNDISLNESCTQLVSCDQEGFILIFQQGDDQKWRKIQRIQYYIGLRICFINDNLIAFQPYNGTEMETFKLNQFNKQFIKYKDVSVASGRDCEEYFPMVFNNKKQLLLNKNERQINLIRYNNKDFVIEQSIFFGTFGIRGAMTEDFKYLVTWDDKSCEFQVRKQK